MWWTVQSIRNTSDNQREWTNKVNLHRLRWIMSIQFHEKMAVCFKRICAKISGSFLTIKWSMTVQIQMCSSIQNKLMYRVAPLTCLSYKRVKQQCVFLALCAKGCGKTKVWGSLRSFWWEKCREAAVTRTLVICWNANSPVNWCYANHFCSFKRDLCLLHRYSHPNNTAITAETPYPIITAQTWAWSLTEPE